MNVFYVKFDGFELLPQTGEPGSGGHWAHSATAMGTDDEVITNPLSLHLLAQGRGGLPGPFMLERVAFFIYQPHAKDSVKCPVIISLTLILPSSKMAKKLTRRE